MKKREMMVAVRRAHPYATAHAFPDGTWEILPDGNLQLGYRPLNSGPPYAYSEDVAWSLALREVAERNNESTP